MFDNLLTILKSKNLRFEIDQQVKGALIITFDVWAKPGARSEKKFISKEGIIVIQTRAKPVEGEANTSVIEEIAALFGVSKSSVEIYRGEKSRQKKLKVLIEFTANKKESYFLEKFSAILNQEASN